MVTSGQQRSQRNFKIVLLGEGCVGKTSLLLRYIEDRFNEHHASTVQASFLNKKINLRGERINLSVWDTAGQEKFHALGPIYYRSSHGAVLVYDITNEESFQKVKSWVRELRKVLGPDVCLVIAGNKADLAAQRCVDAEEARLYAESAGATHFETSAKLNRGIEELFLELAEHMTRQAEVERHSDESRVLVVDDEAQPRHFCAGCT